MNTSIGVLPGFPRNKHINALRNAIININQYIGS